MISNAQKKNEIFVETLCGITSGAIAGVSLVMAFTPVGWVAFLAVGVASAVIGHTGGKAAKNIYNAYGKKIDFASATGVSQLCSNL